MKKSKIKVPNRVAAKARLGHEERYQNKVMTTSDLISAYNWYNYEYDHSDAKSYTIEWLKTQTQKQQNNDAKMADFIKKVSSARDYNFRTLGWICRLLSLGAKLPQSSLGFRDKRLREIYTSVGIDDEVYETKKPTRTAEEKARDILAETVGTIEVAIDKFVTDGCISTFKPYDFFQSKALKYAELKHIVSYYKPLVAEVNEAIKKPDQQLKEAYRQFKKLQLKKYCEFLELIIVDANRMMDFTMTQAVASVKNKKPRKKKIKTPEQLTNKVKYKVSEGKIQSIAPKLIIKASQLWVFNIKTRTLISYIASDVEGLNIKGTKIINYDEKVSIQKKIRKPEGLLEEVLIAGKVSLRTIMNGIKTKESKPNGRLNIDTLLLRVIK